MDNKQFQTWVDDFQDRFPDSGRWMRGKTRTLQIWFDDVFTRLDFAACMEANRRLMASDDPIHAYERETIATRIANLSRQIGFERSEASDYFQSDPDAEPMRYAAGERPMGEVFREMLALKGIVPDQPHHHQITTDEQIDIEATLKFLNRLATT